MLPQLWQLIADERSYTDVLKPYGVYNAGAGVPQTGRRIAGDWFAREPFGYEPAELI